MKNETRMIIKFLNLGSGYRADYPSYMYQGYLSSSWVGDAQSRISADPSQPWELRV